MKIQRFEDIIAWQKSKQIVLVTYKHFGKLHDLAFKNQILRCSLSIMNNIAEGFERMSNKEFINFLYISKGSCGELRSMLYVAIELNYLKRQEFDNMMNLSEEISKLLSGFIKSLRK